MLQIFRRIIHFWILNTEQFRLMSWVTQVEHKRSNHSISFMLKKEKDSKRTLDFFKFCMCITCWRWKYFLMKFLLNPVGRFLRCYSTIVSQDEFLFWCSFSLSLSCFLKHKFFLYRQKWKALTESKDSGCNAPWTC